MGGCLALAFTALYSDRVRGLGLNDTTAWYGPDAPSQWADRAQRARDAGLESMVGFQATRWFTDAFRSASPATVQRCVETFLRNDVEAYAATCQMLGACDLRIRLAAIRVPVRIVVGRDDHATPPAMAEAMHAAIAKSRLTVLDAARHLTPLEHPDRIAAELERLLDEVGGRW